jgi:CHAT domain-containing protein
VIATLWPVYDLSTADLSRAVYDHLLDTPGHTLHVADSATALRAAMLDARRQAPDDPTRWAPYPRSWPSPCP